LSQIEAIIYLDDTSKTSIIGGKMKKSKIVYVLAFSLMIVVITGSFLAGAHYSNGIKTTTASAAPSVAPDGKDYRNTPIVRAAKEVSPAVVGIVNKAYVQDFWSGTKALVDRTSGSGVIIMQKDGYSYLVTNNHVVKGSQSLKILLSDGRTVDGTIVGADGLTDIAVVKIKDTKLAVAKLGNSDDLMVGEPAIAIGSPLGMDFRNSVTAGVISAVDRKLDVGDATATFIQTDAAINPGNSGGALVNANGEVIGINTVKVAMQGVEGLGFAIPINTVKQITDQLISNGKISRGYLGVGLYDKKMLEAYGLDLVEQGVYVAKVEENGPAYAAGMHKGDIITKVAGKEVNSTAEIKSIIATYSAGTKIDVVVKRGEKILTLKVTLEEPKQAGKPQQQPANDEEDR